MIQNNEGIEAFRVMSGKFASSKEDGNNGVFLFPGLRLRCIVSDGEGWDHVSVAVLIHPKICPRCPTWAEMCWIKDKFFGEEEVVFQLHPAKSNYVNIHPFVLHLWRYQAGDPPLPPRIFV